MIKKYWFILGFAIFIPSVSLAEDKIGKFIDLVRGWVGSLIPIFVAIALLYFIWNAITLIREENSEKREEAKLGMWWGVIAMFAIVSIWGLTNFIGDIIGITKENSDAPTSFPTIPGGTPVR